MDIEAIVKKYYEECQTVLEAFIQDQIRAALTELATGYEQHLAESERKLEVSGYAWSLMGEELNTLREQLAESREQAERMLDAIYKLHPLASRTLWMAFVWNDHNFTHPLDYAREEAKKAGLNSLEDAQEFLADVAMLAAAPRRCHLCNYQHGHKIGCVNNPVDIALRAAAPAKESERVPVNAEENLSSMIIDWVDSGIKSGTDWRNGLQEVIGKRLKRLAAAPAKEGE